MSGRRVLITGATTPIGDALVRALLADPEVEWILAVGREARRGDVVAGRVRYERVDLARERSIRRLLFGLAKEQRIDTIVDMAMHRDPRGGARAHQLNVEATRLLLRLAEALPSMRRFVFRSYAEVYARGPGLPLVMDEEHPLWVGPRVPSWVLDRVEADLAACARMGMGRIQVLVLRAAECLAPQTGSQLHDYLLAPVCFRPFGFDPMVNVISEQDLARALALAARSEAVGVFNAPGFDTLPLRTLIRRFRRWDIPLPAPVLGPLYAARRGVVRKTFDYRISGLRWQFGGVLDGTRAAATLGYQPEIPIRWPVHLGRG